MRLAMPPPLSKQVFDRVDEGPIIRMSFPLEGAATPAEIDAGRAKRKGFLERIHAGPAYARARQRSGSDMLLN